MRDIIHLPVFFLFFTLFVIIGGFFTAIYWKPCSGVSENYQNNASWNKTSLDHPSKTPSELIEETQNELKQLHLMKSATIVDTSRGILDETEKSIQEIQSRLVNEAGRDIREGAREGIQQEAEKQLDVLREKRQELQQQIEENNRESRIRESIRRPPSPSPPPRPNVVGMIGGNGTSSGSDLPDGGVYYHNNGSMNATFRVLIEKNGLRSEPANRELRIRSYSYRRPRIRIKFDRPMTGNVILQVKNHQNNESRFKDTADKSINNKQEILFTGVDD